MWHEQEKVEQVAANHGDGLFEQESQHVFLWTPMMGAVMPEKSRSSLFAAAVPLWRRANSEKRSMGR
jgi:hypothetical protein